MIRRAKNFSVKAIMFAEQNVAASRNYAGRLLQVKDLTEVMKLHSDSAQHQMRVFAEQVSEMGQAVTRLPRIHH